MLQVSLNILSIERESGLSASWPLANLRVLAKLPTLGPSGVFPQSNILMIMFLGQGFNPPDKLAEGAQGAADSDGGGQVGPMDVDDARENENNNTTEEIPVPSKKSSRIQKQLDDGKKQSYAEGEKGNWKEKHQTQCKSLISITVFTHVQCLWRDPGNSRLSHSRK